MSTILPTLAKADNIQALYSRSPIRDYLCQSESPTVRWLGDALTLVWRDHEINLSKIDVVRAIEERRITKKEYMSYLRNMRQQVIEGSRWISLAAASMDESHCLLRFALVEHAKTEHKDFKLLEKDYIALGGAEREILSHPKNIGTMALDSYISHQAQRPNPVHAFGASFIIEGMGSCKAGIWADNIQQAINCADNAVTFLRYHGNADIEHNQNLVKILSSPFISESVALDLYNCARVVSNLYALQLAHIQTN